MYFDSLSDALAMAGHGGYVWAAYGLTAVVVAMLLLNPWLRSRELQRRIQAEGRRRAHKTGEGERASEA
jgi:heme exporter protein D